VRPAGEFLNLAMLRLPISAPGGKFDLPLQENMAVHPFIATATYLAAA
jgi:hypothetical protein